jgi:formylglycine-generating enzyme required for sulfatase activity
MLTIFVERVQLRTLIVAVLCLWPGFARISHAGEKFESRIWIRNISQVAAAPLVSLETVAVGDPGNQSVVINGSAVGSVSDPYRIGKYEVTIAEYTSFLNAIATRADGANSLVVESLYDSRMFSDGTISGISRNGSGTAAVPYAYAVVGDGLKPVAYITWFNAARFANWLHNGALATSDLETGAYTLNGALNGTFTKNPGASWWIPSQDEWFKAAYYKGGGVASGYWTFPTQSDSLPQNNSSAESNQANFLRLGLFSVTQVSTQDPLQNYLTAVGTFKFAPSPYGTFDQGGNVEEWTDTVVSTSFGEARITRGGAWNSGGLNNDSNPIPTALPTDRLSKIGFRLARSVFNQNTEAPSGTIMFRTNSSSRFLPIAPGESDYDEVSEGRRVTLEVKDAQNDSIRNSVTFKADKRTIYIDVKVSGNQIIFQFLEGEPQ